MIKYIFIGLVLITGVVYEAWNQRKIRDSEWYDRDFRNRVLSFLTEIRTEPEATRKMLRKLAFEDLETALKDKKRFAEIEYHSEQRKDFGKSNHDKMCNLSGYIDGINIALQLLEEKTPKSYRENYNNSNPTMPKELQEIYKATMDDYFKVSDKEI